jgi:hypothetical protein
MRRPSSVLVGSDAAILPMVPTSIKCGFMTAPSPEAGIAALVSRSALVIEVDKTPEPMGPQNIAYPPNI